MGGWGWQEASAPLPGQPLPAALQGGPCCPVCHGAPRTARTPGDSCHLRLKLKWGQKGETAVFYPIRNPRIWIYARAASAKSSYPNQGIYGRVTKMIIYLSTCAKNFFPLLILISMECFTLFKWYHSERRNIFREMLSRIHTLFKWAALQLPDTQMFKARGSTWCFINRTHICKLSISHVCKYK